MKHTSTFGSGLAAVLSFFDGIPTNVTNRLLQFELPNYTSPPLPEAIAATPLAFQDDKAVEIARDLDGAGLCSESAPNACQILFEPPKKALESGTTRIGVLFYHGALVDPRAYSLIGQTLATRYGIPVAIPIFEADMPTIFTTTTTITTNSDGTTTTTTTSTCGSGRVPLAMAAFPYVEKWVLVGHSFGGIAAQHDFEELATHPVREKKLEEIKKAKEIIEAKEEKNERVNKGMNEWTEGKGREEEDDPSSRIAGMVLLASYIRQDVCATMDFSNTHHPMAVVLGMSDGVLNWENAKNATQFYPKRDTFHLEILGGNHKGFGSYDDSERTALLGQVDGKALIPNVVQRELTIGAILHVASRVGSPLPKWDTND